MSTEQEKPEVQVEEENQQHDHTEVGEHEYTIEELKQELAETKQQAHDNWDKAVRAQAEMENLKRRTQKDLEDAHKFALTGFAKEMLSVMDSLVLGLQAATGDSEEVQKFREGSELTLKQLESVFSRFKIETIDPMGQPFTAELHQAVAVHPDANAVPNSVINVFQKGYSLNGRLLRPAMVVVAKAPEQAANTPSIDEQA